MRLLVLSAAERETVQSQTERVAALAARWSIDPGNIDERVLSELPGIAGEWRGVL